MKKCIVYLMGILFSAVVYAQPQPLPIAACTNFYPYGLPVITPQANGGVGSLQDNYQFICRTAYLVLYDGSAKIPAIVSHSLAPDHVLGCITGSVAFSSDKSLPVGERAEPVDYAYSGWDAGHFASDADMSWDVSVRKESFILSNISPQNPNLNRGKWKRLEIYTRSWVLKSNHEYLIYSGPVYHYSSRTIGIHKVVVPTGYFKVIVDTVSKESLSFIFYNTDQPFTGLVHDLATVNMIETLIGFKLPLPVGITERQTLWPISTTAYYTAKKIACAK